MTKPGGSWALGALRIFRSAGVSGRLPFALMRLDFDRQYCEYLRIKSQILQFGISDTDSRSSSAMPKHKGYFS